MMKKKRMKVQTLSNKEEVVSLGSSDPGETSFLRIDPWSFPRLKPQPSHPGEVAKEVEMKLDIQWWATTSTSFVGFIPHKGQTFVVREIPGHEGLVGQSADEVTLTHIGGQDGEIPALFAFVRQGHREEGIRLLFPILDVPNGILQDVTYL